MNGRSFSIFLLLKRSHSVARDRRRASRLARGVAWTYAYKTRQIAKSGGLKSCKYGGKSVGIQNSASSH